jgi:hypothetical protein
MECRVPGADDRRSTDGQADPAVADWPSSRAVVAGTLAA